MNDLEILEEEIKRKIQVVADGFCPSHPNIRISKTNLFGFKKITECSLCNIERQKMIEQSSNNGRNSSHDSSTSKLVSNLAIQRIYQTDESIESSPAKYIVQYANGDFYEGGLLNNKRNGIGVWILANGDKFEGSFDDDKLHGEGTYKYVNGDIYCGVYLKGKKHGRGTYKWANGDTYEATFVNGREDGNGIYKWNSKTVNVCIDSAEEQQQESAGDKVVATACNLHVWGESNEENGSQTGEGSIDESWSAGVLFHDLELQEKKHEAYIEVLQSAYNDKQDDSTTDGDSPPRCSSSHSTTKRFYSNEVSASSDHSTIQAEGAAQHAIDSGSIAAAEEVDGPSDTILRWEDPREFQDGSLSQSSSSEFNRVSSGDFYQPCLFDDEFAVDDGEVENRPSTAELHRRGIRDDLLDEVTETMHSPYTTNGLEETDMEYVGDAMLVESVYAELSGSGTSPLSTREEEIRLSTTDTVRVTVRKTNLENVFEYIEAAMIPDVSVEASDLLREVPQEERYADCEQVLQDISSGIVFDESSEVTAVVASECLRDRDIAIEYAVALASAALISEQCDDASCAVSETMIASREFSINACIESHWSDLIQQSIDALAWELHRELVAIELECISVATQHITTVLLKEVIESLLYVLVGDMFKESNDSIDRGVEVVSMEAIDNIVAEHLIDIARCEVSEREISFINEIELVFETLRTEISSEEASHIALDCQLAQEESIGTATREASQLLFIESIAEDCRAVAETSINDSIVYYLTATRVALEEVENLLAMEIAAEAETSLSEWDNLIATATVSVHAQLIDDVVENLSLHFSSEELLTRERDLSDGIVDILNEFLSAAVDKESADVVVRVVAERDYSIHAAMECLCDEELLLTAAACTTEIVSEELRALDISIRVAEERIVSMDCDAVVQQEVFEMVRVSLDARALRIDSASRSISADLLLETTKTILEKIVTHEVLLDCGLRDVCEGLMTCIEREVSADVVQASLSDWEERTGLIMEEVFRSLLLDCIRDDCVIDAFFFESLLQDSAEALTTTLLEEVSDHMTEEVQEELRSEGMVLECVTGIICSVVDEVVGECSIEVSSAAWDEEYLLISAQDDRNIVSSVMEELVEHVCMVAVDTIHSSDSELVMSRTSKLLDTSNSVMYATYGTEYFDPESNFLPESAEVSASYCMKGDETYSRTDSIQFHTPQLHSMMDLMEGEYSAEASDFHFWDFEYRSSCEGLMNPVEREVSADVAQASLSDWEEHTGLIMEDVFRSLLLDCIRDDCVIDAFFFESLLQESAEALTTTLLEEVSDNMTEEVQEELRSEGMVLECVTGIICSVVDEVVGECSIELSSAAQDNLDDQIVLERVCSVMEELVERVCMVAVDTIHSSDSELVMSRTSKLLDTSNSVMYATYGTEYVDNISESNFLPESAEVSASYCMKDDGTESRTDSIQFHTPQLHSMMDLMEGEYSVGASEVEFGSCFEGIAWSYAGTGISKPMNISALGSSESNSVENYSADAERSFLGAGEDECTLNSEVAEVMSFMKQSSDGTSEYSADGENSVQFAQRNDRRFDASYPWNVSGNRSEENLTDIPLQSSDHPERLCSDEATGIYIRTSNSDDRAMENVSMYMIYQKESPHEKEWMVSPLADGLVMGGRSVGQLYGSRSTEWVQLQSHSAEDEVSRRSNRYSVVYSINGDVYEGAVSADGLFQGHGKLTFFNGDVYEGSFLNGYRSGTGRYLYINGDVYEGHFKNGCKDGKGVYRYHASGAVYEGSYVNDKRHGHGTYIYPNGGKYVGEYVNGKKTVEGMYIRRPLKS